MRTADVLALDALSAAATQTSAAIPCERLSHVSAVVTVTDPSGAASGTVALQGSNDAPTGSAPFVPTNWADANATVAISVNGSVILPPARICYRFVRLVYTYASGTSGTVTARVHLQGAQ